MYDGCHSVFEIWQLDAEHCVTIFSVIRLHNLQACCVVFSKWQSGTCVGLSRWCQWCYGAVVKSLTPTKQRTFARQKSSSTSVKPFSKLLGTFSRSTQKTAALYVVANYIYYMFFVLWCSIFAISARPKVLLWLVVQAVKLGSAWCKMSFFNLIF